MAKVSQMKQRQSNIELLRILAIMGVLACHGCWQQLPVISSENIVSHFPHCFIQMFIECGTWGCVDIFVLISGWFGIHPSYRGLGKLIYQVLFLLWGIYIVALLTGNVIFDFRGIQTSMGIYEGYWFVMAYIGMYILSPVLNAFVDSVSEKQFGMLLLTFYIFQCYYSWGWGMVNYFHGYSIVFFCGLYLTARYVRLYPLKIIQKRPFTVYIVGTLIAATLACLGIWAFGSPIRQMRYDNPLIILSSVCILVAFSKNIFTNKVINKLAQSCFAVYIIHFNPIVFPYFRKGAVDLMEKFDGMAYIVVIFVYFCLVFMTCAAMDWVRMISWSAVSRLLKGKYVTVKPRK